MTFSYIHSKYFFSKYFTKNTTKFFSKWAVKLVCLQCFYLYPDKLLLCLLIVTRCDHIFCNLYLNHFPLMLKYHKKKVSQGRSINENNASWTIYF